jgi:hypothetical protein
MARRRARRSGEPRGGWSRTLLPLIAIDIIAFGMAAALAWTLPDALDAATSVNRSRMETPALAAPIAAVSLPYAERSGLAAE